MCACVRVCVCVCVCVCVRLKQKVVDNGNRGVLGKLKALTSVVLLQPCGVFLLGVECSQHDTRMFPCQLILTHATCMCVCGRGGGGEGRGKSEEEKRK